MDCLLTRRLTIFYKDASGKTSYAFQQIPKEEYKPLVDFLLNKCEGLNIKERSKVEAILASGGPWVRKKKERKKD